jgi:hypothetical protein
LVPQVAEHAVAVFTCGEADVVFANEAGCDEAHVVCGQDSAETAVVAFLQNRID